jgi:UDP-N-acetylmuramoylalanine--D-glutamate ligase
VCRDGIGHFENQITTTSVNRIAVGFGDATRCVEFEDTLEMLKNEKLVIGLDSHGVSACLLLHRRGAHVVAVDEAATTALGQAARKLQTLGIRVELGATAIPDGDFDLAVLSPSVSPQSKLTRSVKQAQIPVVSELELGLQQASCLALAVTGTNGKGTTASLIERMLRQNHRQTLTCGDLVQPVCAVTDQTRDLDFLVLRITPCQLEATDLFRPAVAVPLNLAPDRLDRYGHVDNYVRACARVFRQQQFFDWAIVQSEALARLRELDLAVPAKIITFSARDRDADLFLDRGLLVSRLPNWSGPLLDLDHCLIHGPHNAENLMAALAVGHALRLPLEEMADALKTFQAGSHRCEMVAEINGVQYVNDSKACNLDAMEKALLATRPGPNGEPNVWLIAGGRDGGLDFHSAGPLVARRVKGAFLIGEVSQTIRSAWGLFTPCMLAASLLEAVAEAARTATSGDVVLLSPACSGLDQFRNYQHRGQAFCEAVKSIGRGQMALSPYMHGHPAPAC